MSETLDIELTAECGGCGSDLSVVSTDQTVYQGISLGMIVEPCASCMSERFDEGIVAAEGEA